MTMTTDETLERMVEKAGAMTAYLDEKAEACVSVVRERFASGRQATLDRLTVIRERDAALRDYAECIRRARNIIGEA